MSAFSFDVRRLKIIQRVFNARHFSGSSQIRRNVTEHQRTVFFTQPFYSNFQLKILTEQSVKWAERYGTISMAS